MRPRRPLAPVSPPDRRASLPSRHVNRPDAGRARAAAATPGRPVPRTVLLVNPFYPKDVNASFGKHVLTPTLALTSLAGATPARLEGALLGREPAAGPAAAGAGPAGGGHHRAPDLRQARLRAGGLVPRPRLHGDPGRPARAVLPRRGGRARRRHRHRQRRAPVAAHPGRHRGRDAAAALPGRVPRLRRDPAPTARSCRAGASSPARR